MPDRPTPLKPCGLNFEHFIATSAYTSFAKMLSPETRFHG